MRFLIIQLSTTTILQQLNSGQVVKDKWKFVQFATIFKLLNKGKPMINYEDFQPLYEFLKFQSNPKNLKHLSNVASWEITKYIQNQVLKATKLAVQIFNFIFLTYDEVIAMDNASGQMCMATLCKIGVRYHYWVHSWLGYTKGMTCLTLQIVFWMTIIVTK